MIGRVLIAVIIACIACSTAGAQFRYDTTQTAEFIVKKAILGEGVIVGNIKYTGSPQAIGLFIADSSMLPFKRGVALCTGKVSSLKGPNKSSGHSDVNRRPGDKQLNRLARKHTYDAAVLEFDFIPFNNTLSYNFFFGSDEYKEFVGSGFNDVFAFYITGPGMKNKNLAVVPGKKTPITINSINHRKNRRYYVSNKKSRLVRNPGKRSQLKKKWNLLNSFEFDGMTTVLKAECPVIPGKRYHIKIAIADAGDGALNSGVFIETGSFGSIRDSAAKNDFVFVIKQPSDTMFAPMPKAVNTDLPAQEEKKPVNISNIEFAKNSHRLPDSSYKNLSTLTDMLKKNPAYIIQIYGYTDTIGSKEHNQALSIRRAENVAKALEELGVPAEKIYLEGLGDSKSIYDNTTEAGRARNRRVELVVKEENED